MIPFFWDIVSQNDMEEHAETITDFCKDIFLDKISF